MSPLAQRILSALVMLPPVAAAVWFGPPWSDLLVGLAVAILAWEWSSITAGRFLASGPLLLADTDALMTAAWCEMLLGEQPAELMAAPKADLYLLLEPDLPWVNDGTRFFSDPADRHRFARIVAQVLDDAAVPFVRIAGQGPERLAAARAAIGALND